MEGFVPKKHSTGEAAVEVPVLVLLLFPLPWKGGEAGKLRNLVMGIVSIQMGGQGVIQVCLPGTCKSFLCDVFHKMTVFSLLPLFKSLMEILNSTGWRWGCT